MCGRVVHGNGDIEIIVGCHVQDGRKSFLQHGPFLCIKFNDGGPDVKSFGIAQGQALAKMHGRTHVLGLL